MNFRIIIRNREADSKIGPPKKIDFRAIGTHVSHPTARKLIGTRPTSVRLKVLREINMAINPKFIVFPNSEAHVK